LFIYSLPSVFDIWADLFIINILLLNEWGVNAADNDAQLFAKKRRPPI